MVLVQAQQHLWRVISKMIYNAVVKSTKARPGIDSYIFNTELSQQASGDVTAPLHVCSLLIADRAFNLF